MEAVTALAVVLKRYDFQLVPNRPINMTTGATIHTTDGLYMTLSERNTQTPPRAAAAAATATA